MMTISIKSEKKKSNMIFSCGPGSKDRALVPSKFYREDEYGCTYYKLTSPLFVDLKDINGVVRPTQVHGKVRFIAGADSFWGGSEAKNFRSEVIENPTYRQLLGAAQRSQAKTRDYHHAFIEGCYFKGYEGDVMILQLAFGS